MGISAIPIGILAPLSPQWWDGKWWLILIVAAVAVAWGLVGLKRKEPKQSYEENVTIRLVVGDLFKQDASAVIGFTTTFDTEVPDVIAPNSLQSNFMDAIYAGSQSRLDQDLSIALAGKAPYKTVAKRGKTEVYPVGTVATLTASANIHYFCAAYTEMDVHNRASGTIKGVLNTLDECWDEMDKYGNGEVICVPLIGQGQSRIGELTPEISARLTAFSFILRTKRSRFASELRIVVHPTERQKVDLVEFQAFLTSLAGS
ncbi:hypothetical protein B7R25_16200 [Subtercola boreus]|uniref:Thoeris protein ThsA Macro domain-containing protein n=1 Tax=Subtercola boreus TaxID=120213 RepID=A0A3E0W7I8_9MICO|nr:hypothetical protein B7R24_16170 [Subtercola boreus]RFA18600.1 hypothetical protein B7R23_16205 [Subtercola boreus]RFA25120.1 hypothetical protein B7R25_16200 [Subtercola boreus]